MKLSIITINYNDKEGLEKTVDSIINQTSNSFEYIVIDGGSTDGSTTFIQEMDSHIDYWVSEKDSGVYNGMNKGIKVAKGEYVLFLNSGDYLVSTTVIEQVLAKIDFSKSICYGDIYYSLDGKRTQLWTPPDVLSYSYFLSYSLPHPASFIKRELFSKYLYYTESYKIVSDWEFYLICICKHEVAYEHLPIIVADFDHTGISSNKDSHQKMLIEKEAVIKQHFPLFFDDSFAIQELESKRVKQFLTIKNANGLKWKVLKGLLNLLFVFQSKKQFSTHPMITKL